MNQSVQKYFLEGDFNCAEATLRILNEAYDLHIPEESFHLVSAFGGGCGCGMLCGALAGSLAALGAIKVEERAHVTPGFKETCAAFCSRFASELGATNCADLRPRYFQEDVRCAQLLEKTVACFDRFIQEG